MRWIFGLGSLVFAAGVFFYFDAEDRRMDDEEVCQAIDANEQQKRVNKLIDEINNAKSEADLVFLSVSAGTLEDKVERERLGAYITLRYSRLMFQAAEQYLQSASNLESALAPESKTELNPLTVVQLKKAIQAYDVARKEVEKLGETNDPNFNYHASYLKGCIYFRLLEFVADENNAQEIFNQTLTHYKTALKNRPADINTVINIELLIKEGGGLNNAGQPKNQRKQMLNIRKAGLGQGTGN